MFRYVTSTLAVCALAGTVNVFAQDQAPPAARPEKEQAPKEKLTGCVMEAKTTDGGKAYVLNNVEGGSAKMYVLAGSDSEWPANVTKKVEVTGQVQQPSAPPAEDGGANKNVVRPPTVIVESVKVVADACK